ncbi:MAG: hypothetical protein ACT4NY_18105 [Pseudonocardiales bacterium]
MAARNGGDRGASNSTLATSPTVLPGVPGAPPKPDAATAAAYVADLEAIDPDIVHGKPDKAVSRGRDQCTSVAEWPDDQAKLVGLVQRRFISPDHPDGFGPEESARILSVVRQYLCP